MITCYIVFVEFFFWGFFLLLFLICNFHFLFLCILMSIYYYSLAKFRLQAVPGNVAFLHYPSEGQHCYLMTAIP